MVTGKQTVKSWETLSAYGLLDKHLLEPPAYHIQVQIQLSIYCCYTCMYYVDLSRLIVSIRLTFDLQVFANLSMTRAVRRLTRGWTVNQ